MPEAALEWIRREKEKAWAEGYSARARRVETDRSTWCENPYSKKETSNGG